ncbi:MAG: hypothetical protein KatS3mg031_0855 [Chitinophagales bacterium]|nr:MAG: hypothetical protein KatS3mg031_0855 [Chitinophagales bacterium]
MRPPVIEKFLRYLHIRPGTKLRPAPDNSVCLYPFFNIMVTAGGNYKPCCKFSGHLSHAGTLLQTPHHTFLDAWNSSDMQKLRQELLRGEKPQGCRVCWEEESKGIQSMRYDSADYPVTETHIQQSPAPLRIDLYPSNVCNLKCRICSPHYSSKWIPEARETLGVEEEMHLNLTEENFSQLRAWLPNIVEIGLFGGEPLYLKETHTLLEYCVEQQLSKNITLLINTNATIYSDRLMGLFHAFKKVILNFSIDDIEKRFEYQRKGAKWEEAVQNMQSYLAHGGSTKADAPIECKICCTISIFNIFYLPELLDWIDTHLPGMRVYLNLLHGPYALSVRNLPGQVKTHVISKIAGYRPRTLQFQEKATRTLDNVVEFLNLPPNVPFTECLKEIKRGDIYRKESFEEVFPEMHKLLQQAQA